MFLNAVTCIEVVSRTLDGVTVGQIQKAVPWLTRGQVERTMRMLEGEGYVWAAMVKYGRTGKRIYRVTEQTAIAFASIARQYTEACAKYYPESA